jgi:hypothetical protein
MKMKSVAIRCTLFVLFSLLGPLPVLPAQTDTLDLSGGGSRIGSIPAATMNNCFLDQTQYKIDKARLPDDLFYFPVILLRARQNVDLYVRYGERVTVEDGKIIADYSSKSSTGIERFDLFAVKDGTYFVAVSNCSESAANYYLTYQISVDLPSVAIVRGCEIQRRSSGVFSLKIIGDEFKPDIIVAISGVIPKKLILKNRYNANQDLYSTIVAKGKVCQNLPGLIQATNVTEFSSQPFFCNQRCPE